MKKLFLIIVSFLSISLQAQVGINTTSPTATLHVYGNTTLPTSGTQTLLNQNFDSAYTVVHSSNTTSGCSAPATVNGWERTTTGNTTVNCTSCTGGWLYIYSDELGCDQNSTASINFTSVPTSSTVTISFDYRYNYFTGSGESFRAYLWNNTTNSIVGTNLVGILSSDANTSFSGTRTVVAGNSYSIRFEYLGTYDYGASIDNVLITEVSTPTSGAYTFRLEDGTQAAGKVMTSDANGNAYWATPSGGSGTDSQTLSIAGSNLSISGGNTVTLPSGTDSQTLSISGSTLTIANGNSITLPSGSSSNTYTNGLTLTGSTVRLGGTLTQGTSINLDNSDLTFSSNTSVAFPGQIIFQGTNRVMMDTDFAKNYINFGGGAFIDSDDGTSFNDSGSTNFTKDFVAGFHNGSSGGTAIALGSIEYVVDGMNELFLESSGFSPMSDETSSFGNTLGKTNRRWGAVYATNGVITTSDMTLKTNVQPLTYGLKELLKLNTITYNWKNYKLGKTTIPLHKQEKKIGFSAQQLLEILPEVVQTHSWVPANETGDYKEVKNEHLGVNYSDIIPVTVKAIQEQQVQIEELKREIEELKSLVKALQK